jgi:excisionase family DNA binding protein
MTLREVADYLNCHYITVYRLINTGLPAFRLGSDWRFQRSDLKKWIAQQHDMVENRAPKGPEPKGPEPKAAKARPKSKA